MLIYADQHARIIIVIISRNIFVSDRVCFLDRTLLHNIIMFTCCMRSTMYDRLRIHIRPPRRRTHTHNQAECCTAAQSYQCDASSAFACARISCCSSIPRPPPLRPIRPFATRARSLIDVCTRVCGAVEDVQPSAGVLNVLISV